MSWTVWETELGETHIVPNADNKEHSHTDMCWCKPVLDDGAFVHHSADRREHTVEKQ